MATYRVLYNPTSANGNGKAEAEKMLAAMSGDTLNFEDITAVGSYSDFFAGLGTERLVVCGGDGTLNRFINDTEGKGRPEEVWYFPAGTGNDFANDIGIKDTAVPVEIGRYLKNLPTVTVNGKKSLFLNGIGYGIDGYCCEVGDAMREAGKTDINYAGIAIKGLLFHFKPRNAKVTVDGKTTEYRKVWLAPAMNGRMYGGGMIPTPDQKRFADENGEKLLSVLVWNGSGKISTLANFPNIFKGEHLKKSKMCRVLTGKKIEVEFDGPCALQIDGDTVLGVTSYTAEV
ncbi:MAG: diacylglycerol kinase family protein [Clostridia bacterium]|nr:diacylglycerol kinase family protein [Clostridia bacterium]